MHQTAAKLMQAVSAGLDSALRTRAAAKPSPKAVRDVLGECSHAGKCRG